MKPAALALCFACGAARLAAAAEAAHAQPEAQRPRVEAVHVEAARHAGEPRRGRVCFSPSETREKITSRRLSEPFRLLRGAAGATEGEALWAKLCRWNEDFVYEIALLRHDGRIVHVYLNAVSGQAVTAFGAH